MDYKGYRLPRDLGLLTGLFFLLIYYSLLLRFKSLPDILAALRKNIDQGSLVEARLEDRQVLDKLWRGCSFILIRIFRTKKPCLRRALVLYSWCCKHNIKSTVVIGFFKNGRELTGHSWLIVNGLPFNENPADLEKYITVIEE